jgi:dolichyl-phosphate-mannose--protein O-mannosyl transferase
VTAAASLNGVLASPGLAQAAEAGEGPSGKAAGVFAGAIIFALLCYALYRYCEPLLSARDRSFRKALALLLGLLIVKIAVLTLFPGYQTDVGTYEAWALKMAAEGPAHMYAPDYFLDYPPGYLYALWLSGWLGRALDESGGLLRLIVETPALVADFALAALMFVYFQRLGRRVLAWAALSLVALNPALFFDSVVWGQIDSALTFALMLSVMLMLESEWELCWALAALAVLIKPQAFALLPVLGLWTLLKADFQKWWRSALSFVAVMVIGAAPFQLRHSWRWLPDLYLSTAAYYHETSVNAFNFMALLGGNRVSDAETLLGVSYFALGMALMAPLYAFVAWMLSRNPSRRNLFFVSFIALFGFFMFAPRMHERYLGPAVVFAIPLAVEDPAMLGIFVVVTLTCLFNLAYVLHTLKTTVFMDARDGLAMMASLVNLFTFAIAAGFAYADSSKAIEGGKSEERHPEIDLWERLGSLKLSEMRASLAPAPAPAGTFDPIPWLRIDTLIVVALVAIAAALRFWHIGHPSEIVFDEVHFVGQARHYIHREAFLDPHPPLAKLLIAVGILLFGDHSWSWRLGNATLGTIMVGVTYLLGRRMFRSRMAAVLAAAFVLSDGFFIVDSRIGCIDIVYLTLAAIAYWLLFRFMQTADATERRRTLIYTGVTLGLCLGAKLYVPAITFLLVIGFVAYTLARPAADEARAYDSARHRQVEGAVLMVGGISAAFYLATFLPHYFLGWWGGIADLFHYYKDVMWYENSVSTATHPYASPWWSWPLMLRPVAYWQDFPARGPVVSTIWGAGNPLLWWAVIPAITITAVRALERPNVARAFIVIGYLAYFVIWIPIGRILFLYHYMPSVYLGYLALAAILADFWNGEGETWETLSVMFTLFPVFMIGLAHMASLLPPRWLPQPLAIFAGVPFVIVAVGTYVALLKTPRLLGRFVVVLFLATALTLFIYYLPVWLGMPIARSGYYARMWFEGPGLRNWI